MVGQRARSRSMVLMPMKWLPGTIAGLIVCVTVVLAGGPLWAGIAAGFIVGALVEGQIRQK